jgi:hypothetical protein
MKSHSYLFIDFLLEDYRIFLVISKTGSIFKQILIQAIDYFG